jgi:hypothetical protein
VAATVEDSSGIDHHAGRMNLAGDYALRFDLDASFGKDHTVKAARDHDAITFDLALDFGALSEDHRLIGDDVSLDVPIDAERPFDGQRSFERYALVDESCPLFDAVFCGRRPLPSHEAPPKVIHYQFSAAEREVNDASAVSCRMNCLIEGAGSCPARKRARAQVTS